jgi:hypothetical protein
MGFQPCQNIKKYDTIIVHIVSEAMLQSVVNYCSSVLLICKKSACVCMLCVYMCVCVFVCVWERERDLSQRP